MDSMIFWVVVAMTATVCGLVAFFFGFAWHIQAPRAPKDGLGAIWAAVGCDMRAALEEYERDRKRA